jgi:hypothetical protein
MICQMILFRSRHAATIAVAADEAARLRIVKGPPRPAPPLFSDPITATPATIAGLHATACLAASIRQATPNDVIRQRVKIQSP